MSQLFTVFDENYLCMIDSLPSRSLRMKEIEALDNSSEKTAVSAVSILVPENGSGFNVYTILVDQGKRHLIGFDENMNGWMKIWDSTYQQSYEDASEEWMRNNYGDRIESDERVDFNDV